MPQSLNADSIGPGLSTSSSSTRLLRNLSLVETWGFGLTGLLLWMGVAPATQAELGHQAMWVWIPGAIIGVLINLQVRALGRSLPDVSGGTPNYVTYLLKGHPKLTSYAAIGYFISWVAVLPVNAIILSDLTKAVLEPLGIALPDPALRIGFTVLAFIVAFSGSQALGTLHLVFLLPAVGFLLAFCLQGSHTVIFSTSSFSLLPDSSSTFSLQGWAKWYLNGTYAFYACETASVFVADSKRPFGTLQSLLVAAGLIPIVYIGGSWVLLHLATEPGLGDNTFLNLLAAAKPFWGQSASFLVTFLVVSSSLLSCATAVSICPRILYQLAQDHHLSPIFGVTSRQGVFAPGLLLTLILSLLWLLWGNVPRIVMITGVGWFICFIVLHWGLWQQRDKPEVLFPRLSLGFCAIELLALIVGGFAWGLQDLLIGLLLPIAILLGDQGIRRISWKPLKLQWWIQRHRIRERQNVRGFIALHVFVLILFICGATIISWSSSTLVASSVTARSADLLVVLILVLSFIGVAIACWTIFPQIVAVNEARKQAERLSDDLRHTLEELQQTQLKMVQQEKMAALGQLVAGIAHEVNTPLGAIQASIGNITNSLEQSLKDLPVLLQALPLNQQTCFFDLLDWARQPKKALSSREERQLRRTLKQTLVDYKLCDADTLAETLSRMAFTASLEPFLPLLSAPNALFILDTTYNLFAIQNNSHNIQLAVERAARIVYALKTYVRQDASGEQVYASVTEGIDTILTLYQNQLKRGVEVIKIYEEVPLLLCYPEELVQVWSNLIGNALQAMNYQGQLSITVIQQDQHIVVKIQDSGCGVPPAIQGRIFEAFFTTKPRGEGSGLGLSIVQKILDQHNGKIEVMSVPGETIFQVWLPQSPEPSAINPAISR